jgi:hypothetical protein
LLKASTIIDIIIFFVIILFLQFFSFTKIEDSKLLQYGTLAFGLLLTVISFFGFLFKKGITKHPLDKLVFIFIISMITSSFLANAYWNQSFFSSLRSYIFFYIYFLYFFLIVFNVSAERIKTLLIILFFISLVIFLIDYVTFPNPLFSWREEERRNGITIFFFGQGFTFAGAFYFLSNYFNRNKIMYLFLFFLSFFCLFFLTQSRMNLLALVLGFFFVLLLSDFKRKYVLALVVIIAGITFYFSTSVFKGIKETTKEEAKFYKENIRLDAENYFLTELQAGVPTMLFGNGVPSDNSDLGVETTNANLMGYWTSDVGLTGIYSYFGLLGVIIWISFFYFAFKVKITGDSIYVKAYFLMLLTAAFTGFAIFDPGYMPATILLLYLLRCETSIDHSYEYAIDFKEKQVGLI